MILTYINEIHYPNIEYINDPNSKETNNNQIQKMNTVKKTIKQL